MIKSITRNMLNYKDFLNENNNEVWTHKGDFEVTKNMVSDGRFIKGKIPTIIKGTFYCYNINLTSLEGGPNMVKGHFNCDDNNLASLEGCPKEIGKSFHCSNNKLTSLEGSPVKINDHFSCSYNDLTTLIGGPKEIGETFYCRNNNLTSLEGGPNIIGGIIHSNDNKKDLTIESKFIESGSFKQDFYKDLLNYCIINKIALDNITSWPENFLTDNIKASAKVINKFNL